MFFFFFSVGDLLFDVCCSLLGVLFVVCYFFILFVSGVWCFWLFVGVVCCRPLFLSVVCCSLCVVVRCLLSVVRFWVFVAVRCMLYVV